MTKDFDSLARGLSKGYENAVHEAIGQPTPSAPIASKLAKPKRKPKSIMPSKLDGKVYAFPGEILTELLDGLELGQNAYVPLAMLITSSVTARDFEPDHEIKVLRAILAAKKNKQKAPSKLTAKAETGVGEEEDDEDESQPKLTSFQELYLDLQKNGQVDALKVFKSKSSPGKLEPIEGNRRLVALRELGYKYVYVTLYPEPASTLDLVRLSQSFNQKRGKHSIFDLGKQWKVLVESNISAKTISDELGVSKSYVSKALAVASLYDGTKRRLRENPNIFSERLAIHLALLERKLSKIDPEESENTVLAIVREALDFKLTPEEIYALAEEREAQALGLGKTEEPNTDKVEIRKTSREQNPFKQTARLYAGPNSEPVGFLSVDSKSKNIRVGVNFSGLSQPAEFLSELQKLVHAHGLKNSVEPKIFDEEEIGERLANIEEKTSENAFTETIAPLAPSAN